MANNNPALVKELINGMLTMDQAEFERKFNTLSDSDMSKVNNAMNRIFKEEERKFIYGN